jgi:hypothetical protein
MMSTVDAESGEIMDLVEITLERRGTTLRARGYLNRHGFVAVACRRDYPADTVTENEILDDIAKEFAVDVARGSAPEDPDPIRAATLTLGMGSSAYGARTERQ